VVLFGLRSGSPRSISSTTGDEYRSAFCLAKDVRYAYRDDMPEFSIAFSDRPPAHPFVRLLKPPSPRPMKQTQVLSLVSMALFLNGCDVSPQKPPSETLKDFSPILPHQVDSLEPKDLGIFKYTFESMTPAGKAMVLRWTKTFPDRQGEIREIIGINTYQPVRIDLLIYNSHLFPFNPDRNKPTELLVKLGSEEYRLPPGVDCSDVRSREEPLALYFTNKEKWSFTCFLEEYNAVKARFPDLGPAPRNGGWTSNPKLRQN
jgi:hypothetical protein